MGRITMKFLIPALVFGLFSAIWGICAEGSSDPSTGYIASLLAEAVEAINKYKTIKSATEEARREAVAKKTAFDNAAAANAAAANTTVNITKKENESKAAIEIEAKAKSDFDIARQKAAMMETEAEKARIKAQEKNQLLIEALARLNGPENTDDTISPASPIIDVTGPKDSIKQFFKYLIPSAALFLSLVSISAIILGFFFIKNKAGKEAYRLKKEIIDEFNPRFEIIETGSRKEGVSADPGRDRDIIKRITNLENKNSDLEFKFRQLEKNEQLSQLSPPTPSPPLPPPTPAEILDNFNAWAVRPAAILPSAFYYLKADMKIRTIQNIDDESLSPTKWITNRIGEKKFLFPNPNSLDDRTDITSLYTYDLALLKPKGQNRIKIISPCEMMNNGFIQFAGELQLI